MACAQFPQRRRSVFLKCATLINPGYLFRSWSHGGSEAWAGAGAGAWAAQTEATRRVAIARTNSAGVRAARVYAHLDETETGLSQHASISSLPARLQPSPAQNHSNRRVSFERRREFRDARSILAARFLTVEPVSRAKKVRLVSPPLLLFGEFLTATGAISEKRFK
jgi:hypothetical protein